MSPSMLLWVVGIAAAGVALLIWGLRGKRIDDHPVCRQCRFDLAGQPEGTITCPECGAGLKRTGSVRIGQRRKRPIVILLGVLGIALPMLALGTLGFAIITGQDLNSYKPLGLLKWEAGHADAAHSKVVAAELHKRMMVKGVSQGKYDTIVQLALEQQGDTARKWSPEWGDIIEQAQTDGKLSKEDKARYRRQAAVVKFESRPRVRAGDDIPVAAKVVERRVGGTTTLMALAQLSEASIGGKKARFMASTDPMGRNRLVEMSGGQVSWFYLYGTQNRWGWGAMDDGGQITTLLRLPADVGVGRHTVNISLGTMTIDQPTGGGMTWPSKVKKDDPNSKFHEATFVVDIVPAETPGIELVTPTADEVKKMETLLEPTGCQIYGGNQVMMQFNLDGRPMDFAFDVVLKTPEREWKVAPVTSGTLGGSMMQYGPGMTKQRQIWGAASGFRGGKVDVVLRPNEKVALQTTSVARIYGKEIVLKDVEFANQGGIGGSTGTTTILGDLVRGLFGK